jgi:predicted RNA-binding protein associated with RNAse of E/G family
MDPATILLIIQGIQAAISAAPVVEAIVVQGKNFITSLFEAGLISKATQDAAHAHVDAYCAAALAGQEPPQWTVEADPS